MTIANTHASSMRSRVIVFKLIHRIRVDGRKRCENATRGLEFFENGEKKLRFPIKTDTCGRGLNKIKKQ